MKFSKDDKFSVRDAESYLKFQKGDLDHIPIYARFAALTAIENVKKLEESNSFRPGVYYIALADLCDSTSSSAVLGSDLNRQRVETFVLSAIEALGNITPRNYLLPVREIGDAVLVVFASFRDVFEWWREMNRILEHRNWSWSKELTGRKLNAFMMKAKTVVHAGEVAYSDTTIPMALSVNQTFKIEKQFGPNELGITEVVSLAASPVLTDLDLQLSERAQVTLPGELQSSHLYLAATWRP